MEVFNLDIIPGKSVPVIHASQFDAGREFKANLFEGPTVYTLSGAETLSVIVRKPDGNMVTAAVTNTSDSYIIFETTEQMTACDGANLCELRIENGVDVIGSINFIMEVEKSPDTGITSASEIHNLAAQVDAFTAIAVADQYDSANVIFDNSPTPGHGNGYAVTSEGVETALSGKANNSDIPVNSDFSLSGLSDTTITTPQNNQLLGYSGGKWKNTSDLYYNNGTINIGNLDVGGWITSGRSVVRFTVPLPKKIPAGKTITIGGKGRMYSDTGTALVASGTNLADWGTWTFNIIESGVECLCSFANAFSSSDCTNNTLQTIYLESTATLTISN